MVDPHETLKQAAAHLRDGRLGEARALAEQVALARPDIPDSHYLLSFMGWRDERYEDGRAAAAAGLNRAPVTQAIRLLHSRCLEGLGRDAQAAAAARAAAVCEPAWPETLSLLGLLLKSAGQVAAAAAWYDRAARLTPGNRVAAENAALCRHLLGDRPADWTPPKVAVVIPCYNYGRYVVQAVESALAQTHPALDVIVVNGGSDDAETNAVIDRIDHPKVRVLRRDRRCLVGDNRNFGVVRADAPYVCCLDADDMLDPRYIEKAVFYLDRLHYDVVSSRQIVFGDRDARPRYPYVDFPDLGMLARQNYLTTAAVFRRACWERAGGYHDYGIGAAYVPEDWDFWLRLAAQGARMVNMDERLFHYRHHGGDSLSHQGVPWAEQRRAILERNRDALPPDFPS